MKLKIFSRRKPRVAFCLAIAVVAASFLYGDAAGTVGEAPWVPGPGYLAVWLSAVLLGGAAIGTLIVDSLRVIWKRLRPRGEARGTLPVGGMVPRL